MRRDPAVSKGRSVTVLPGAVHLRRVVGPTAWVVLETLLQDAEPTSSDEYLAHRSIRDLAAEIGLAKDTVARAIRALREVGLIKHAQCRTGAGTFDPGRYAISLPNDVITTSAFIAAPLHTASRSTPRATTAQLSLAFEG
jgi:DNA-binding transcriptional ArsR family regulator